MKGFKNRLIIVQLFFLLGTNLHAERVIRQFVKKDYLYFSDTIEAALFDTSRKMDLRQYFLSAIYTKGSIAGPLDAEMLIPGFCNI